MQSKVKNNRTGTNAQWFRVAAFCAIGLVLAFILQELLLFGLKHCSEGNVGVMNRVARGGIHADIVISGSSRAAYHYDSAIVETRTGLRTINIGRDGTKLHEQLNLLQIYLQKNPHPQYVIQNLDMTGLEENYDVTDGKQYIAWLRDAEIYKSLVAQKHYYWIYRLCPLVAICRQGAMDAATRGLLHAASPNNNFDGYSPQNLSYKQNLDKFMAKHGAHWKLEIDPNKLQSLKTLAEICKTNRINLIFVFSPDYGGDRHFFENRDEIVRTYKDIAEKLNVPFWDYSNDPICIDQSCFYNSQHMNVKGATLFSKALAERLASNIVPQQSSR